MSLSNKSCTSLQSIIIIEQRVVTAYNMLLVWLLTLGNFAFSIYIFKVLIESTNYYKKLTFIYYMRCRELSNINKKAILKTDESLEDDYSRVHAGWETRGHPIFPDILKFWFPEKTMCPHCPLTMKECLERQKERRERLEQQKKRRMARGEDPVS